MFSDKSRYKKTETIAVTTKSGKTVQAVKLRKLVATRGNAYTVKEKDRLDIMMAKKIKDPTRFWHVADANTELEANDLVNEPNRTILVPEQ